MLRKKQIAVFIASALALNSALAEQMGVLPEIKVTESVVDTEITNTQINKQAIQRKQPSDLKALFANQLDAQVNDLQNSRAGNDGVNVRGLQGNRVAMSIDGVPLPETQENKLFVALGQDFGAGNSVEPTSLRSATVQHSGSFQSLSGSVSFATLEANDVIQSGNVGGFVATGYDSSDRSIYGSVAGAAKNENYQGLVLTTARWGNEKGNNGKVGGEGDTRTKPNPVDYKNSYVLVKNAYRLNDQNQFKLTFEHQQKIKDTSLLSNNGSSIDRAAGEQLSGFTEDKTRRSRISLGHQYQNDSGFINTIDSNIYYQNAMTQNYRERESIRSSRVENGKYSNKNFGISSNFISLVDATIPNAIRYGFAYHYSHIKSDLVCSTCSKSLTFDPVADTKQSKTHFYIEDEIALNNFTIIPHLGVLHYRLNPSKSGYVQAAAQHTEVKSQKQTVFLPKITLAWKMNEIFQPYFQYSRGVKTPSAQQLTSSFGNTVVAGGRIIRQYAVVGNANLRPETADNFSLGVKGKSDNIQYHVVGYYNKYRNFIDSMSSAVGNFNPFIQYHNLDKARIYGVTADAKWSWNNFFISGGLAYAKGKSDQKGKKSPINTIQPLKLKAGLGYEGQQFGTDIQLTHISAKSNKDINGKIYNPTTSVNIIDLGAYWKPVKNLTLSANVNNVFNKKYWNWSDISYFAVQSSSASADRTATLNKQNVDTYSALGRNFNVGVRYEF
ncbi:TonB-dependent hemoglobin/transferrin/lactoferrin family receptor [Ursidibacter maritimus]|uniref:TonB-dependent hemoglobin/transferrin/lactoferrin family receptor n=2 Tax=Ursidibacter maritimus TaxID=1331689 RepID=A0A949WHU3_9PAST|nr:TonB-dependent receptor [Ursidibacter maritimus]MBV6524824.1 TonB-dependent hemoglobin/transferrin/lactoferrin family receptor [Ursidibacter maritimus]MBV6526695.1 TonB-dependent hemoglobin/transferrin/lactoferrin family receptor [Ursidibacter maritimus]MBV6527063.1 TonB-dependent hemoglobin/transferrin/lactoferrin family receptor [Ursidibacter maritimus]MBV6530137.1 TonB-dependent hemoglobin/transferrin/lactoferrin family receptor [Ursidibacter maritimus]